MLVFNSQILFRGSLFVVIYHADCILIGDIQNSNTNTDIYFKYFIYVWYILSQYIKLS